MVKAIYTIWLFTNRSQSLVNIRVSVVAACSACDPGEGVLANGGEVTLTNARLLPRLCVDGRRCVVWLKVSP